MHLPAEFWVAIIMQLLIAAAAWGDLRAQVRNLGAAVIEEKRERERADDKLESSIRDLRPTFSLSKKAGG